MWFIPPGCKSPTRSEYAVLAVLSCAGLVALGLIALVAAIRAPEEKAEAAAQLTHVGLICFGLGVIIGFGFWLFRRLVD
jgi:sterol desaturase/sphingolipid hydroxylase (fatty acid hydroxylase superfamily)